jgi:hypothetical protein
MKSGAVKKKKNKAIIIHQPSPYVGDPALAGWSVPKKQSTAYHGDAELHVPVVVKAERAMPAKRASALDALRGFFLLSMTFGFAIMSDKLPVWMYHRQFPPPGDTLVDIAGISWRDVTYGSFLFSMAAAIPIILARRIARGVTEFGIIGAALRRGFMLFVFALLIGHSNPYFIGYTDVSRGIAIVGFVIIFLLFTRAPATWNQKRFETIQKWDWLAAALFLALSPLLYGKHFTATRIDDIIWELAFAATTGWIIWYFTRHSIPARLVILAAVVVTFLLSHNEGRISEFWYSSPLPWLWSNSSLVLLCVVIPGTIAGDLVLRWMDTPEPADSEQTGWSPAHKAALLFLAVVATPILVVGMYNRWHAATTIALLAVGVSAIGLSWRTNNATEKLVRDLFIWGTLWLMVGMAFEPLWGGIRKVPDNLSYYFSMAGASIMMLLAATIVIELFKAPRALKLFTDVGQNPMLCYILFTIFLNSVFELIPPMRNFLLGSPGLSLVRTALTVVLVALITREFTRRKIFWRA